MSQSIHQKYNLRNWLTFLLERAPPAVFALLAAGPCLTGLRFIQGYVDWEKFLWSLISQLVLLLVIRVMDDVKDYEKDKIVHPDRPLPRGLVQYDEVKTVISYSLAAMYVFAVLLMFRFSWTIGIIYALQVSYAVLMYIEFGIGEWFEKWVFLYAFSHQVSIYFGSWFICALAGAKWYGAVSFLLGSVAFSGFFTYEVCRKLDPTLPKLKGTYLVVYGKWITFLITCFTVSIGVVSSYMLSLHRLLWPLEAVMILSLVILFNLPVTGPKPRAHKPVEALSVVYLLVHMWSGFIASFW